MGRGIRKNRIFWGALLALGLEAARKGALAAVLSLIVLEKGTDFHSSQLRLPFFQPRHFCWKCPAGCSPTVQEENGYLLRRRL